MNFQSDSFWVQAWSIAQFMALVAGACVGLPAIILTCAGIVSALQWIGKRIGWCVLLLAVQPVTASEPVGTVSPQGYTLRADGYWWLNGTPHTKSWSYAAGCTVNGCYKAPYYYAVYTPVKIVKEVHVKEKLLNSPTFEKDVIEYLDKENERTYRDKIISSLPSRATSRFSNAHLSSITISGSTLYGAPSVNALAAASPAIDVNAVILQYQQAAHAALGLGDKALAGSQALAAQTAESQRQQTILALSLQALSRKDESSQRLDFKAAPEPLPAPKPDPLLMLRQRPTWAASAQQCVKCHQGPEAKGNFQVESWWTLSDQKRLELAARHLATDDAAMLMPKGGPKMPASERLLWLVKPE